ncbi:CoA-binding protein [Limnoraphis robusta CS-951]|uniref:CoA-binding protein n=3 Tax=Limnoraphis TaxID=1332112 RepID=A0A0J9EUS7_9CYAN|nr:CoA-binding protein [Limnoraphis robusta CS-951]
MANLNLEDEVIAHILTNAKVIAVVGHSDKPSRTSYQIAQFLRRVGYRVYAVNPTVKEIEGECCYASLEEIPERIDIVNVFRRAEFLSEIVSEAIAIQAKTVWGQLGVIDAKAAQTAIDAGLTVVMDRCIKIEYARLNVQHFNGSQAD